ncbi:MAG: sugar phosphate isomerase/epimerase [Clostridia bacterium]|nr:sugar phosphate isomerase/epimerase [Clostridia bacterium]
MKIGISSGCWYPDLTEDSAEKIHKAGYNAAEIFICDESENDPSYLTALKNRFDKLGIKIVSVHPYTSFAEQFLLFSEYERRRENTFRYYRKYHTACKILGAEVINFHGATKPIEAEKYAEIYAQLYNEAKDEGLTFCQENVRKFTCGKASYISELKGILGENIAFTLDVKQAHMEGEDLNRMIEAMGQSIKLVHISDHTEEEPCLLPGFGNFDTERFLKQLKSIGYDGYIMAEIYSKNCKNQADIEKSRLILQDIINKI